VKNRLTGSRTSWLYVLQNQSYCRSKFYIAEIGITDLFAPVTLTLALSWWPSYTNLTRIAGDILDVHMNFLCQGFRKWSSDRQAQPKLYTRSIHTARFIVWQPRRAADTSTYWRQSLFCCCTASMEQATDAVRRSWNCCDRRTCFVVIWKHFCFILLIRIDSLWCALPQSSSRGAIQVPQLQLQLPRCFASCQKVISYRRAYLRALGDWLCSDLRPVNTVLNRTF